MYCSECGKKNPDMAKFCAYCGAKLLTEPVEAPVYDDEPDWDAESRFDAPAQPRPANEWAKPQIQKEYDDMPTDGEAPEAPEAPKPAAPIKPRPMGEDVVRQSRAVTERSPWAKPDDVVRARRAAWDGAPSTIVPLQGQAPEPVQDLFFDGYDNPQVPAPRRKQKVYREKKPSFLEKNLRGIVGIALTMGTIAILAAWLFLFPSGQQMMARFGLTDNPAAYAAIAQNALEANNYSAAAQNYYQALLLDDDNYDYALKTAQCYQLAGSDGAASTALTMAIDINASDIRAYQQLQRLYPDRETRPKAVSELLSQGATLTGDASLRD